MSIRSREEPAVDVIETEVAMLMRRGESTRRAAAVAPHRALDRAAYVILRHLDEVGPRNVSALAEALGLDGSTVTRQVIAMQGDGLVTRRPDPHDGRGTVIEATPAGLARMATVRRARQDLYARILADWTPRERATLATLMRRLNESIDAHTRRR